jgi:hypothetical protein
VIKTVSRGDASVTATPHPAPGSRAALFCSGMGWEEQLVCCGLDCTGGDRMDHQSHIHDRASSTPNGHDDSPAPIPIPFPFPLLFRPLFFLRPSEIKKDFLGKPNSCKKEEEDGTRKKIAISRPHTLLYKNPAQYLCYCLRKKSSKWQDFFFPKYTHSCTVGNVSWRTELL